MQIHLLLVLVENVMNGIQNWPSDVDFLEPVKLVQLLLPQQPHP